MSYTPPYSPATQVSTQDVARALSDIARLKSTRGNLTSPFNNYVLDGMSTNEKVDTIKQFLADQGMSGDESPYKPSVLKTTLAAAKSSILPTVVTASVIAPMFSAAFHEAAAASASKLGAGAPVYTQDVLNIFKNKMSAGKLFLLLAALGASAHGIDKALQKHRFLSEMQKNIDEFNDPEVSKTEQDKNAIALRMLIGTKNMREYHDSQHPVHTSTSLANTLLGTEARLRSLAGI